MIANAWLRRLVWRLGRRLYVAARGEPSRNDPAANGELHLAARVVAANAAVPVLAVLDVGANVGDWTVPFVAALPAERRRHDRLALHLFEPTPTVRAELSARLAAAGIADLVTLHAAAVSDTAGTAEFAIMSDTGGTNTLALDDGVRREARAVMAVEMVTLADAVAAAGLEHVHLVKVDVEGHDLAVLRGARPLLAQGAVDVVQFEYNFRWIPSHAVLRDVFALVEGLPYSVARVMPDHLEVFEAWHFELERYFEANYVLVHERALGWFDARHGRFDVSNTYA